MTRPHVTTPAELSSLRDLELATRSTVEGLRQGRHRSPFHGYSAEFSQYRHYRPGDDLKYVDWKAFGRTNRLFTRQFRETTNLSAMFVVDVSRSMEFATKFQLAQAVTAVLGTLVIDQGDQAGLIADGRIASAERQSETGQVIYVPARSGHRQLPVFLSALARLQPTSATPVAAGLQRAATLLTRRGLVIAVSDFYDDDSARPALRRLARMGHDVIVIQTMTAEEIGLNVTGVVELVDAESGRTIVVQPDEARTAYQTRLREWLTSFEQWVRREGLDYLRLGTHEPLERSLRRFLVARRSTT